jgi:hypothetical protein
MEEIYCNQHLKNIIRVRCVVDPAPPGVAPDGQAVTRDDNHLNTSIAALAPPWTGFLRGECVRAALAPF